MDNERKIRKRLAEWWNDNVPFTFIQVDKTMKVQKDLSVKCSQYTSGRNMDLNLRFEGARLTAIKRLVVLTLGDINCREIDRTNLDPHGAENAR